MKKEEERGAGGGDRGCENGGGGGGGREDTLGQLCGVLEEVLVSSSCDGAESTLEGVAA